MTRSLQTADIQLSILLSVPYPFYIIDYIRQNNKLLEFEPMKKNLLLYFLNIKEQ